MKRLYRSQLIDLVVESLRRSDANDLPMIRQTVNDICDTFRRDGYAVTDFAQDRIVAAIQQELRAK